MKDKASARLYHGPLIHSVDVSTLEALPRALLAVSSSGTIEWVEKDVESSSMLEVAIAHGWDAQDSSIEIVTAKPGEWLMPGFIDTHTHGPQYPNIGSGGQYELLDWLSNVTFPLEEKFEDPVFARDTYESVVKRIINCGTTTCCYYGTLHLEATKILADVVHEKGQRAFVGKCNMDRHCSPTYQESSATESHESTKELITYIRSLHASTSKTTALVHPILTPRFAISCTDELLGLVGDLAREDSSLAIQTHISENLAEIEFTQSLFPHCESYAHVYDHYGLLTDRTILAHAVHLGDNEVELIKQRGAGISHCPTSNFNLRSGVAPVGKYIDAGVKVGLGTDVSGGFAPSILTEIRHASIASKVHGFSHPAPPKEAGHPTSHQGLASSHLSLATLLYLATVGGASLCNLTSTVGTLEPGKDFDALLVSVRGDAGNPAVWWRQGEDTLQGMLERFFFCGDDRNIRNVWVRGRLVGGAAV